MALLYLATLFVGVVLGLLLQHLLPRAALSSFSTSRLLRVVEAAAASAAHRAARVNPVLGQRFSAVSAWARQQYAGPGSHDSIGTLSTAQHGVAPEGPALVPPAQPARPPWHVGDADAVALTARMAEQDAGREAGWKHMMDKSEAGTYSYTAHKRPLPGTKRTEYRTVTTVCGASPRECMEFLLDDVARRAWEGFLVAADILEVGNWAGGREEVVRWVRRFPFHFLTDREYLIARKAWADVGGGLLGPLSAATPGGSLYAVTRGLDDHPAADHSGALVRTGGFDSCWRCAAVADPFGGPEPATAITLLHTEDIKIPEYLARTAVAVGMSKFVGEMAGGLSRFVRNRRARGLDPHEADPLAYGHDFAARAVHGGGHKGHGHRHGHAASAGGVMGGGRRGSMGMRPADDEVLDAAADYGPRAAGSSSDASRAPLPAPRAPGASRLWLFGGGGGGGGAGVGSGSEAPVSAQEALHLHPRRRHHGARSHLRRNGGAQVVQESPSLVQQLAPGAAGPVPVPTSASAAVAGAAGAAAVTAAAGARLVVARGSGGVMLSSPTLVGGARAVRRSLPGAAGADVARGGDQEVRGVLGTGQEQQKGGMMDDVGAGAADVADGPLASGAGKAGAVGGAELPPLTPRTNTWATAAAAAAAAALQARGMVAKLGSVGAGAWADAPAVPPPLPSSPLPGSWGSVVSEGSLDIGGADGCVTTAAGGAGAGDAEHMAPGRAHMHHEADGVQKAGGVRKAAGWTRRRVVRLALAGVVLLAGQQLGRAATRGAQHKPSAGCDGEDAPGAGEDVENERRAGPSAHSGWWEMVGDGCEWSGSSEVCGGSDA